MASCFIPAQILLPGPGVPLEQWACLACDQYTSQPEYWQEAEKLVGDSPSTLRIILPEVWLEAPGLEERIESIHATMKDYAENLLTRKVNGFVYLERDTGCGFVRQGLVGAVDLEAYEYTPGSRPAVRPTESTVVARIPPRLAVRRGACLETPHVMMLVDDPSRTIIEPLAACKAGGGMTPLYSGKLMQGGGTLRGWALEDPETCRRIVKLVEEMGSRERFDEKYPQAAGQPPITLAVGDGNHSLATAKAHWEEIKAGLTPEEQAAHPARYCLVELCNIHSPAIGIEPIHRVVFGAGGEAFAADLRALCKEQGIGLKEGAAAAACPQQAALVWENGEAAIGFESGTEPLCVGTVEKLIGLYLAKNPAARVDYIHGDDTARSLAKEGAVAFILPDFDKGDIFKGVVLGGVLPRKTFSMGHADEKRYYMECRRIEP